MSNYSDVKDELSVLIPKSCPFPLQRIGGNSDGAYLIPEDLEGIQACFSPGVNNFKTFEDELTTKYGISCHMCDYSSDADKLKTPLIEGEQTFRKKWLDIDNEENCISLEDWVEEQEPGNHDLLLQMDIEGAEYRNLISCPKAILQRFRIIVIELHGLGAFKNKNKRESGLAPLLRKLNEIFICVHAHPNNCCGEFNISGTDLNIPNIIEVTFLRKDRFENTNRPIPPKLPHPLDIVNLRRKPPLFLNEHWYQNGETRPEDSTIKLLQDELEFFKSHARTYTANDRLLVKDLHKRCQSILKAYSPHEYQVDEDKLGKNIAENKPFFLSSSYRDYPKEGLVKSQTPFFFHTDFGQNESITIALEEKCELEALVILNRTDGFCERAQCIFYLIHDEPTPNLDTGLPVSVDDSFLSKDKRKSTTPLLGASGKFLTIFSPENTALHFEAIQIFARL